MIPKLKIAPFITISKFFLTTRYTGESFLSPRSIVRELVVEAGGSVDSEGLLLRVSPPRPSAANPPPSLPHP